MALADVKARLILADTSSALRVYVLRFSGDTLDFSSRAAELFGQRFDRSRFASAYQAVKPQADACAARSTAERAARAARMRARIM